MNLAVSPPQGSLPQSQTTSTLLSVKPHQDCSTPQASSPLVRMEAFPTTLASKPPPYGQISRQSWLMPKWPSTTSSQSRPTSSPGKT